MLIPKNVAPASPMKERSGRDPEKGKLKKRYPNIAAPIIIPSTCVSDPSAATSVTAVTAISAMDPAKPSSPSIKLNALMADIKIRQVASSAKGPSSIRPSDSGSPISRNIRFAP